MVICKLTLPLRKGKQYGTDEGISCCFKKYLKNVFCVVIYETLHHKLASPALEDTSGKCPRGK
jgi:hypothetical protein